MSGNIPVYSSFSLVYDKTMMEVPYERWAYYILEKFEEMEIQPSSWILDIGAGTGVIAEKISSLFKIIALDMSREMLFFAKPRGNLNCIQANMVSLPIGSRTISGAYSTHDCINYLTTDEQILNHLKEVHRILKKKGIYIIDFSTEYNVLKNFHNRSFQEKHDNIKMDWTNVYDPFEKLITSTIEITVYPKKIWRYMKFWSMKKFREVHIQRIFNEDKMNEYCKKSKFDIIGKNYDYKKISSGSTAHLVVYILQKN